MSTCIPVQNLCVCQIVQIEKTDPFVVDTISPFLMLLKFSCLVQKENNSNNYKFTGKHENGRTKTQSED